VRDIRAYIEVNGNIVSNRQVAVVPDTAGKLVSVKTGLGSFVRKGEIIAEVDQSRPGERFLTSPVYAPVSGIISTTPLPEGSTIAAAQTITVISASDELEIEAFIPEGDVADLKAGLSADVLLRAFPGEVFSARVTRVSPVLDSASRTKKIVLRFDAQNARINPGMFARLKLYTRLYPDAIAVPDEALISVQGRPCVYIIEGYEGEARAILKGVEAGLSVDGVTRIVSGLEGSEEVVIQGQRTLSNGAAVRIIAPAGQDVQNTGKAP
jgi:RND family efflux transporter MFP subunit